MSVLDFVEDQHQYPISAVAKNEWLSFAMYTVESRAIPNMIDGLKISSLTSILKQVMNSADQTFVDFMYS